MVVHCELVILILALTLDDQVHTGEITGGHKAVPHSRPYMVLLERHMQNGKIKGRCGGFLLSEDFVMTAAHCQASSYTALLGVHNVNEKKEIQRVSVKQAFPRKDYNATDYTNDMMILKLSSKANISKNVRTIALAGQDDGHLPESCSVSGWGRTLHKANQISPILMEVNVRLIEQCPKANSYCSEGENGPDVGDSGGPLVCEDGKAYGVVSAYKTDSDGLRTNSYAKISDYRDWIDCIMENDGKLFCM